MGLFWGAFAAALLIFLTLFIATDAMSTLAKYKDVSSLVFLQYYAYFSPEVIYKMLPIACVVGMVVTISNLNKGSELVALFASGLSLFRISRIIFFSILMVGLFSYYMSDQLMPLFNKFTPLPEGPLSVVVGQCVGEAPRSPFADGRKRLRLVS